MDNPNPELFERLAQGPAVLFLGQKYLSLETGKDPFIEDTSRKFGPNTNQPSNYSHLLEGDASISIESSLAWMYHRCDRISIPEWLKVVAGFAWSSIYTSAIDTLWYRAFRSDWRDLFQLFEEKYKPLDPRSRTNLHCTFLYGCINRPSDEIAERPPLTERELRNRKQEAIVLARRLPEILTPFGTLVIEGYDGETDWFDINMFLPIIDKFYANQVHIFSVGSDYSPETDLQAYIDQGIVKLYTENLGSYLSIASESGKIKLGLSPDEKKRENRIQIANNVLNVPPEIWNLTSRSASILDDRILLPLKPLSKNKKYFEYRNFLSESSIKPIWSGYNRNFAFHRKFEDLLYSEVEKQFQSHKILNEPIILHGQSGTGKSVALGALAFNIRKKNICPVLFIERKSQKPSPTDIDVFCKWAEDIGAPYTLVIWDGMINVEAYSEFLHYLVSRGRKVILVGSCYYVKDSQKSNFITAPATLEKGEISRFNDYLYEFDEDLPKLLETRIHELDKYFLVMIYRLLPSTRTSIRQNLEKEVSFAEQQISIKSKKDIEASSSSFAYALLEAGFITEEDVGFSSEKEINGEMVSEIQEIIGLIMVPGRFGLKVPFELLMRTINKSWMDNMINIFSEVDIFRWYEDNNGNILIGPRHPLEADLIVRSRLGTATSEVAFAEMLITEIKGESLTDNLEINFAVELIRSMGPNREHKRYFSPVFLDLAKILRGVREKRGIENPRLMLQEASLLREWVVSNCVKGNPPHNAIDLFKEAEDILLRADELLVEADRGSTLRGTILVELGAILASRTQYSIDFGSLNIPVHLYDKTKEYLYQAISINPDDYYPFDVLFWMSRNLLNSNYVEEINKGEISVDLLNAFSQADPDDFDAVQKENFFKRSFELGKLVSQDNISDQAIDNLLSIGSKAGYYLKAYSIVGEIPFEDELTSEQLAKFEHAVSYLQENFDEISEDSRCLNLLLRLWWMSKTGKPILFSERQTIPFDSDDWIFVHNIISKISGIEGLRPSLLLNYLDGISLFHLDRISTSFNRFREIERESERVGYRKRVIRKYLVSNPDSSPREFHGTVAWVNDEKTRGELDVEELRCKILFIPLDFRKGRELKKNDPLRKFHIAFNFIGPIADPISYLKT